MKVCSLACGALILLAVPANAREESRFHLLLNGGASLPQKPDGLNDVWSNGFNVGGGLGYRLSRRLTVQAEVNYNRFPFDEGGVVDLFAEELGADPSEFGISFDIAGAELSVLSVLGELKASFGDPNKITFYMAGGGGVSQLSIGEVTISGTFLGNEYPAHSQEVDSKTHAMATIGAGVEVPISERVGIFGEARYEFLFRSDEGIHFVSVRVGITIGL